MLLCGECVGMSVGTLKGQRRVSAFLDLELQVLATHQSSALSSHLCPYGATLGFVAGVFSQQAITPAQKTFLFEMRAGSDYVALAG